MPGNPFSAFEYAGYGYDTLGTIFASSLPHGCNYDRFWMPVRYGGYWQLPLNTMQQIKPIGFPRIGKTIDRPVGNQMRHFLTVNGQPYKEYIIFKNYADGVDVYVHNSAWELDLWAYYTIDGPWEPQDWYLATSMTFIRNQVWTSAEIYEDNKRKHGAIDPDEDPMNISPEESMYNTAVLAMTPTTMEHNTPDQAAIYNAAVAAMPPSPAPTTTITPSPTP